jgi:PPK2 family polyphosphate:nucleotide phosphotransferase
VTVASPLSPWRVRPRAALDLAAIDPGSTPAVPGDRAETEADTARLVVEIADLQERLRAEGTRSLLVVLQAMDAGGKDGTVKKVFGGLNPEAIRVRSFKGPTPIELAHDFLWRIHAEVPARGEIGVFNRSHYEDVLVVRVDGLVPEPVWRARYRDIRHFEEALAAGGTTVVKVFLHISPEEQAERFLVRMTDPAKQWKFHAHDLDVRARWADYREAYGDAITATTTAAAPWFVVPADRKWYRNWAVATIVHQTLAAMDPKHPPFDPTMETLPIPEVR